MKILVTGGNGFLGKVIVQYLRDLNITVDTLGVSASNSIRQNLKVKFDDLKYFDFVIHAAGIAHIFGNSATNSDEILQVNINGTINLLNALNRNPPKKFIYISSVSVYGITMGFNVHESFYLNPQDQYGISKMKGEKLIKEWCNKNDVTCTIFRLPLVIGANPPGNLKNMIRGIQRGYYFNISGGKARKSMVLASDVAKYILKAGDVGGTYNLTDGYHPNFYELSHCISKQIGKKYLPNMPIFIARMIAIFGDILGSKFPINTSTLNKITSTLTFDDSRARQVFGWNPTPVLTSFRICE